MGLKYILIFFSIHLLSFPFPLYSLSCWIPLVLLAASDSSMIIEARPLLGFSKESQLC